MVKTPDDTESWASPSEVMNASNDIERRRTGRQDRWGHPPVSHALSFFKDIEKLSCCAE
jgi:hypothetical protein